MNIVLKPRVQPRNKARINRQTCGRFRDFDAGISVGIRVFGSRQDALGLIRSVTECSRFRGGAFSFFEEVKT